MGKGLQSAHKKNFPVKSAEQYRRDNLEKDVPERKRASLAAELVELVELLERKEEYPHIWRRELTSLFRAAIDRFLGE